MCNVNAVVLPNFIEKCSLNDPNISTCILNTGNSIKPYVGNGIKTIGVPRLNPFRYPYVNFTHTSFISDLQGSIFDLILDGLHDYEITKINFDPQNGIVTGNLIVPFWKLLAFYTVNGVLAQIRVVGNGIANANFIQTNCEFIISNPYGCDNLDVKN